MEQSKVLFMDGAKINVDALTVDTITDKQVFKELFNVNNLFTRARLIADLQSKAKALGKLKDFNALLKAYRTEYIQNAKRELKKDNLTTFTEQPIELFCGDWKADDLGVRTTVFDKEGKAEEMYACPHPILITERYINIETGREKAKLDFYKDGKWQNIIVEKKTIASRQDIVNLSGFGVQVTSETASFLVRYFYDLESLNIDKIQCFKSTERLGWVDYLTDFIPYVDNIKFDGENNNKVLFECIKENGDFALWLKTMKEARTNDTIKIMLATSLASPIIAKLNKLPFFVHIWGSSGTGKTVALMVAASIWGNPALGKLVRGLNSTAVGMERLAAFFNNVPCFFNELQTIKHLKHFDDFIYKLCEGMGKERGNKFGGNDKLSTWCNCYITNGEQCILNDNSGAGASNRIIEMEVNDNLFEDARLMADTVIENYGFAGKKFVEYLKDKNIEDLKADFEEFYLFFIKCKITEKQAMAGALICVADKYANELFWNDEALDAEDVYKYLKTEIDVDQNLKAVELIKQWIASNNNKFNGVENLQWGKVDGTDYVVMSSTLQGFLRENEYDYKAVYKHLVLFNLVDVRKNEATHTERINGIVVRVLRFKDIFKPKIDFTPVQDTKMPF